MIICFPNKKNKCTRGVLSKTTTVLSLQIIFYEVEKRKRYYSIRLYYLFCHILEEQRLLSKIYYVKKKTRYVIRRDNTF